MPGMMSPTALMLTVAGGLAGFCAAGEGGLGTGCCLGAGAGAGVGSVPDSCCSRTFCTAGFDARELMVGVLEDL